MDPGVIVTVVLIDQSQSTSPITDVHQIATGSEDLNFQQ